MLLKQENPCWKYFVHSKDDVTGLLMACFFLQLYFPQPAQAAVQPRSQCSPGTMGRGSSAQLCSPAGGSVGSLPLQQDLGWTRTPTPP